MPSTAQIKRWRARRANGRTIREIANEANVAPSTVHRALSRSTPSPARVRPTADIGRIASTVSIAHQISIMSPSMHQSLVKAVAPLNNVHTLMLAADVTRVLKEVQRDVLRALGFTTTV